MGVRQATWVLSAALQLAPPPVDDRGACRNWTLEAARALLVQPQPRATGLGGVTSGGLSEVPEEVWTALASFHHATDGAERQRRRLAVEGKASTATIPEVVNALPKFWGPVERILRASLGPANRLPDSFQLWCLFDCPGHPSISLTSLAVPLLASVSGWNDLERGRPENARLSCLGLWGFLRADAGAGALVGQLRAERASAALVALCLATAQKLSEPEREELLASLELVEREWPSFSHTLTQELLFMEVRSSSNWPMALQQSLPSQWRPLSVRQPFDPEPSAWGTFRATVFGTWAEQEQCLRLGQAVRVGDASVSTSDTALLAAGKRTLLDKLAADEHSTSGESSWLGFARRYRRLRTQLRMLTAALRTSLGRSLSGSSAIDARSDQPLEVRTSENGRVIVAVAFPSVDAEELRVPVPENVVLPPPNEGLRR
jgi:hypothetical protein